MNRPRPPSDTYAAIVAVATICSIELRMPEMISGNALGTSTRQSTWLPVMPMPLAASRAAGSTLRIPAYVAREDGRDAEDHQHDHRRQQVRQACAGRSPEISSTT